MSPSNLQPFLSTELTYRSSQETEAISDVKRFISADGSSLMFSKVIRGNYARLITYENNFLQEVHNNLPHARVVKRKSDTDLSSNGKLAREIVTENAGVDISKWYALPVSVDVNGTRHSYPSAFCHPVMLLNVTLHILKVFKGIHEAGIVHCDIKEDQICIPANVVKTGDSYDITPDFDNITLIDFGNALWERVYHFKDTNPLPFNTAKALPYQAQKLIEASKRQQDYFKKQGEYSFTQALKDVDYSVDLYSLGYMLQQMLTYHIKPNLSFSDPYAKVWNQFLDDYERLVDELMQYNTGLIQSYSTSYLPHDSYISQVNHWLSLVSITSNIIFITSISNSVTLPTLDPTPVVPTPLLDTDTPLVNHPHNSTSTSNVKRINNKAWFAVLGVIGLCLILFMTVRDEQNDDDTSATDIIDIEKEIDMAEEIERINSAPVNYVDTNNLEIFINNGLYGFKDGNGKVIIDATFDYVKSFSEGLARVKLNDKWGFIDKQGNLIIDTKFDFVSDFIEGLAVVEQNDKYGFIDKQGNLIIDIKFDFADSFSEGLARVKLNDKYGFIDKQGNFIIDIKFDYAEGFSEGSAKVILNDKYVLINKQGNIITDKKFDFVSEFIEGLAVVELNDKYGLIDKQGNLIIDTKFDFVSEFIESLAVVELNDKYGFIDKQGNLIIEPKFDYADSFSEGLALVNINGKRGYIEKQGNFIIDTKFDRAHSFSEGLAGVNIHGKWGFIDKQGNFTAK